MPRTARATCRQFDYYPWYEWVDEFVWEDDEFEDLKYGTIAQRQEAEKQNLIEKNRDDAMRKVQ